MHYDISKKGVTFRNRLFESDGVEVGRSVLAESGQDKDLVGGWERKSKSIFKGAGVDIGPVGVVVFKDGYLIFPDEEKVAGSGEPLKAWRFNKYLKVGRRSYFS